MHDDQKELLWRLFCSDVPEPQGRVRMKRLLAMYELGKIARQGVIVELGTYHGAGATALWMGTLAGSRLAVYTVDDYDEDRVGVKGDRYDVEDYDYFWECLDQTLADIRLILGTSLWAADTWTAGNVGLLYWDLPERTLAADFAAWEPNIPVGGMFAIHDHEGTFGAQEFIKSNVARGAWKRGPDFPDGGIYTITRIA